MKAINDLYEALRKRRENRRNYRLTCKLPPAVRRDIGVCTDHVERRAYRV